MEQTWSRIVWAHWPVEADEVADLLPPGLVPETFDGSAWVGLVPFQMTNLRLPGPLSRLTATVRVASFGEVNVRTYVRGPDGRTGVWFATLDADRVLAVLAARIAFGLPYRLAVTRFESTSPDGSGQLTWSSVRRHDRVRSELLVAPDEEQARPAAAGLEQFLVERYALYSWWHGRLLRGSLSHAPWRVRRARPVRVDSGTVDATGISVRGEPHVLVGEPVEVRIHPFGRARESVAEGAAACRRAEVGPR